MKPRQQQLFNFYATDSTWMLHESNRDFEPCGGRVVRLGYDFNGQCWSDFYYCLDCGRVGHRVELEKEWSEEFDDAIHWNEGELHFFGVTEYGDTKDYIQFNLKPEDPSRRYGKWIASIFDSPDGESPYRWRVLIPGPVTFGTGLKMIQDRIDEILNQGTTFPHDNNGPFAGLP